MIAAVATPRSPCTLSRPGPADGLPGCSECGRLITPVPPPLALCRPYPSSNCGPRRVTVFPAAALRVASRRGGTDPLPHIPDTWACNRLSSKRCTQPSGPINLQQQTDPPSNAISRISAKNQFHGKITPCADRVRYSRLRDAETQKQAGARFGCSSERTQGEPLSAHSQPPGLLTPEGRSASRSRTGARSAGSADQGRVFPLGSPLT
jgi:hypothetical protein